MSVKGTLPYRKGEAETLKMPFTVACAFCKDYSPEAVGKALGEIIEKSGGMPPSTGKHILLKPNLLSPRPPEDAVTTHPAVVRMTAALVKDVVPQARIRISDNPGYIYTDQQDDLFRKTGMTTIQEEGLAEVKMLSADGYTTVKPPDAAALESARVASSWLSADCIINIAKLKTHVETEITASIKNTFGIADRTTRMSAHGARKMGHLQRAVVDLFNIRQPDLNILDAVICMEGNGPSRGTPRFAGWLLASRNALALDIVAACMMGYDKPFSVPLLREASKRGFGPKSLADIRISGAHLDDLRVPSFRKATSAIVNIPDQLRGLGHRMLYLYPELVPEKCTSCGICKEVCPVQAITIIQIPEIDRNRCVKCLCCHEMCPQGAMTVRENTFLKIFRKMQRPK
jgi:uncharacterized protein (DUF362 family)/NAD-dependent dihydropyrimidine dehydrogenase PreA subunit